MIYNIKITNGCRKEVLDFIGTQKNKSKFTVIDVGGSLSGWSSKVIDAVVDFNDPDKDEESKVVHFKCDITHPDSWKEILEYVAENGKFDFCICTHTLEDIMNPAFVCEQICKIAKTGYISFPSKHRELSRCEGLYRGYIHHRFIFTIKDNKLIAFPKVNFIDFETCYDSISSLDMARFDLSFYWRDNISIEYVNNNYLGPGVDAVKRYYRALLDSDSI